jgi:hypothetical protein
MQALSIERKRLWQQWEAEFGQRPRQTAGTGSGGQGDSQAPSPAPRRPRQYFADTAEPIKKEAPKAADSQVKAEFDPAAKPDNPPPKPGWKQRRSAAERKADGTYKPRQRKAPKPRL